MKLKGKFRSLTALLVSLLVVCTMAFVPAFAEGESSGNHYNVVLVVDGSGSMTWTDSQNWRYEAINQFVGLLSQEGNCLGGIVFDQDIQVHMDLTSIHSKSDKAAITEAIENYEVDKYGDTNIGAALDSAVEMLSTKGDKNLPSVIVLLSDGNTDLDTEEALKTSLEQKAEAIENARENNIPIYTVCLNEDGSANITELKQISDATGGVFEEVSNAADLKKVFSNFYNLIYGTSTHSIIDPTKIGPDGKLEADFDVPSVCVQEVNIVINGDIDRVELTKPDGSLVSPAEITEMTTSSKSFTLVKIVKPQAGSWHIVLYGMPGDTIQVDMVYNSDFRIAFSLDAPKDIAVNTTELFSTVIYDGAAAVTGKEIYEGFTAKLVISDAQGNIMDAFDMRASDAAFELPWSFPQIGTYYLSTIVEGQTFRQETAPVMVNVGNSAPYLAGEDTISKKVYLIPFKSNEAELDLSGMAKDAEDDKLTYQVVSTAFLPEDYELSSSGMLTMKDYSVSKGSFTVNAYDSMGAYCSFTVKITTVNVTMWTLILIGAGILIAAAVIALLTMIALKKPFAGTLYAQSLVGGVYSQWSEVRRSRGRVKLSAFGISLPEGIDGSSYLQASGKNYVTLVSKTPFFCRGQQVKEMKVTSYDIEIRSSANSMDAMWIHFNGRLR